MWDYLDGLSAGEFWTDFGDVALRAFLSVSYTHLHQVVVAQMANARQGTKSTLTRSEVRGGGIKPWRQKGTGRARQGSIRAVQWIKGGVAFEMCIRDRVNEVMGDKKFEAALRKYFDTCKLKLATKDDMLACFEKSYGANISNLFNTFINGRCV